ncbi:PAS domain-containing protein [Streptomyces sp. NPDC052396]|uniref:PAS domain-containing protein n=1 Tax=Streptomyces sp. NPDC052396 TaxID=3365689 RepID=UPI0037CF5642
MSSRPSRGAARLAAILDALPDALLLVNCNGTVVNANHIALGTFEVPGTGLVGRGLLDLLPSFDSRRIPGSMRLPEEEKNAGRTRPTRMIARRTDGTEFPVEVTSANLEDGRTPYADAHSGYTGDELLMIVVRDLTGTLDTEAELARQQRQTEMILRAAAEGVVGVDTAGKVVLVNPSAAQILGYRASDLGGRELHPLIHHSRADGSPFPYEESPIADTLRSGRKHRVRGQVLWAKDGRSVPVDLTTAPVRDGDQLVGAVMTFTDRRPYDALAARHQQLVDLLDGSVRGPLKELRAELGSLADDPAGQLWPEANQILHHLAAGYGRMAKLVDNVLAHQQLETGESKLVRRPAALDEVVAAGVEGAVELIGPGRAQFAVHAPELEVEVDPEWFARALAHLIADVAGVDATGNAPAGGTPSDSTIVVAAAKRDAVVRIEVRGPYAGGDPVHQPIVRGVVRRHGGVLQTHEVPGAAGGQAYVLEVPLSSAAGPVAAAPDRPESPPSIGSGTTIMPMPAPRAPEAPAVEPGSGRRAKRPVEPAEGEAERPEAATAQPTGRRRAPAAEESSTGAGRVPAQPGGGRRARRENSEPEAPRAAFALPPAAADRAPGDGGAAEPVAAPSGRRARRAVAEAPELPIPVQADAERPAAARPGPGPEAGRPAFALPPAPDPAVPAQPARAGNGGPAPDGAEGSGGRPGAPGDGAAPTAGGPAAPAGQAVPIDGAAPAGPAAPNAPAAGGGSAAHDRPSAQGDPAVHEGPAAYADPLATGPAKHHGPAAHNAPAAHHGSAASGSPAAHEGPAAYAGPDGPARAGDAKPLAGTRTLNAPAAQDGPKPPAAPGDSAAPGGYPGAAEHGAPAVSAGPDAPENGKASGAHRGRSDDGGSGAAGHPVPASHPVPAGPPATDGAPAVPGTAADSAPSGRRRARRPLAEEPGGGQQAKPEATARPISVRTLGQGAPFAMAADATPPGGTGVGSGRRRKLANPAEGEREAKTAPRPAPAPAPAPAPEGRAFAIGAPDEGAEGPEPLDGPNGAVEILGGTEPGTVTRPAAPRPPVDDELPPEPLDNPRRLLVWPAPDASTEQALTTRGYRPVIVHSREEVDAQISAYPAALFVDPLTGPITRTALQSLRQAAVANEVPVLVTAGLGQATREAAYGADPAVLLKALAPRDSEMHPARVLLIEEHEPIANALTATLERRGIQVACAATDSEAVTLAGQIRPNLVVMDLMQVRRRRAGIIDWLRGNGMLSRTPLVVYTSAGIDPAQLPGLASGETVLFLAERSTSAEVQGRIVDLLGKIGADAG